MLRANSQFGADLAHSEARLDFGLDVRGLRNRTLLDEYL
jgi:hypothetical protein